LEDLVKIVLPSRLDAVTLSAFCCEMHKSPEAKEYVVDFGRKRILPPFSMLMLAAHLRRFRAARADAKCRAINFENHTYPAHMGLFKAFGLDHGNAPGEAAGSSSYVPITHLDTASIINEAIERGVNPGVIVDSQANTLAKTLTQSQAGDLVDTLTFSIREIIRNVVEHSEAPFAAICAQYWPTLHKVEVAIVDDGRGIREALSDNDRHEYENDRDAVHIAMMPGISGNIAAGRSRDDEWQNSGYGLYMTNRICRQGGTFSLYSGSAGLQLAQNAKLDVPCDLKGTAVSMVFDTRTASEIQEKLKQFSHDGEQWTKSQGRSEKLTASTASQMLTRDFQ
jgi:hypothetical protein